jgi:hypothetical protein
LNSRISDYCRDYASIVLDPIPVETVAEDEIARSISSVRKDSFNPSFPTLRIFKKCSNVVSSQLALLFATFLSLATVPSCFKFTTVTPVWKGKGSRCLASNYRPISCLNLYSKVFEAFIFSRIQQRIDSQLCDQQHGFRRFRSCQTALDVMLEYIYDELDKPNSYVVAVYFDAKSAFNSVDYSLLLVKLMEQFRLPPEYIKLLHSYLSGRKYVLKGSCNEFCDKVGLVQGGTICPLLYAAFQDDISKIMELPFLLYADDLVIYLGGNDLNQIMEKIRSQTLLIDQWYLANNMKLNYDKTKYQVFSKPRTVVPNVELEIGGHIIEKVDIFKYLGVLLDSKLTFIPHYDSVVKRVSSRLAYLYGVKRYLSEHIMKVLVYCYVWTVVDYGIEYWGVVCQTRLEALQSKIDSFLACYFLPSLYKKRRKRGAVVINSMDLLDRCDMLNIPERRDLVLLKRCFINAYDTLLLSAARNRGWPRLVVKLCKTSFSQNSPLFRAISLWNAIPRGWVFEGLSFRHFVDDCKDYLRSKRVVI